MRTSWSSRKSSAKSGRGSPPTARRRWQLLLVPAVCTGIVVTFGPAAGASAAAQAAGGVDHPTQTTGSASLYGTSAPLPPGAAAVGPALADSPALALFNARARAAAYDFILNGDNLESTVALCHRLDGLPLAIELAAAHCDVLTPAAILAQLTDRLDLPGAGPRGVPARQQTLRGAIDWSYTLLESQDQDICRQGALLIESTVAMLWVA